MLRGEFFLHRSSQMGIRVDKVSFGTKKGLFGYEHGNRFGERNTWGDIR